MKTQAKHTLADLYKIKQIKSEIQDLREQLSEIDSEINRREQDKTNLEPSKKANPFQEWLNENDNAHIEPLEEDKEKLWGNYILVILLVFYLAVISVL
jgi:archaellum component FlaC